jgi:hypothetical protein
LSGSTGTRTRTGEENAVDTIDIVFEYDDLRSSPSDSNAHETSLQRMIQSDDFRNRILRAAGIDGHRTNIMRWIVASSNTEELDGEPRGLTLEETRSCTESLVYTEGMEGLLSNVCPITMEEYAEGDRLLRLRECRHAFRERELVEWFSRHSTCPVCRTSYRSLEE